MSSASSSRLATATSSMSSTSATHVSRVRPPKRGSSDVDENFESVKEPGEASPFPSSKKRRLKEFDNDEELEAINQMSMEELTRYLHSQRTLNARAVGRMYEEHKRQQTEMEKQMAANLREARELWSKRESQVRKDLDARMSAETRSKDEKIRALELKVAEHLTTIRELPQRNSQMVDSLKQQLDDAKLRIGTLEQQLEECKRELAQEKSEKMDAIRERDSANERITWVQQLVGHSSVTSPRPPSSSGAAVRTPPQQPVRRQLGPAMEMAADEVNGDANAHNYNSH